MKTLTPQQAQAFINDHHDTSWVIVDVRSPEEFAFEHVEGSLNMPLDTVLHHTETLKSYDHVFLYCQSGNRSSKACTALQEAHIPQSVSIDGGITAMRAAGFPVLRIKKVLPLQQQVLLGAGSIVLLGIVLSALVNPWFQLISAGAGLGLSYAGLTGKCTLSKVLSVMPWNRS